MYKYVDCAVSEKNCMRAVVYKTYIETSSYSYIMVTWCCVAYNISQTLRENKKNLAFWSFWLMRQAGRAEAIGIGT